VKTVLAEPALSQPVELVVLTAAAREHLLAPAVRLETHEVDVRTPALAVGARLSLRLRRWAEDPGFEVRGCVMRVDHDGEGVGDPVASIALEDLTDRARAQLADLALWDAHRDGPRLLVKFRGRFDERTDFSQLDLDAYEHVSFDMSMVARINSWGARQWIMFLRSLREDLSYDFVHGSLEFVKHCNMISDMQCHGRVLTFFAPYACEGCNREVEHELDASRERASFVVMPPIFECSSCGGRETLDDVPQRYFAFLS
jgi:hypothetical protein